MFGFCLYHLQSLDVPGRWAKNAAPGEWYWYRQGHYRIGITLHLITVVPAGLLMPFQFVPAIRRYAVLIHRISGYSIILLILLGNVGALMIVRRSFGGELPTQGATGVLAILTSIGMLMAWLNIKRLQIEQHRAWMLRTMFYLGTIITTRIIMIISAQIISKIGSYHVLMTCGELFFMQSSEYVVSTYPACASGNASVSAVQDMVSVPVHVKWGGNVEEIGATLRIGFGMALWLALFMHAIGVEIYLKLTPREAKRLRKVSYERQVEAGYSSPGSSGLVPERFGDAEEWKSSRL